MTYYPGEKYILLIGEGNFSFAASLASSPNRSYKIIATDLKSSTGNGKVSENEYILTNIKTIEANQGLVFLDVDATKLEHHPDLQKLKDSVVKIVFNFPHVQTKKMHLGANRKLLKDFFKSVSTFLLSDTLECNNDGLQNLDYPRIISIPVEVSLCSGQSGINEIESKPRKWGDSWQITEQAASGNFILTSIKPFTSCTGSYVNSGYRDRSNSSFNAGEAHTFTFLLRETLKPLLQDLSVPMPPLSEPVSVFTSNLFSSLKHLHCSNPMKKAIKALTNGETNGTVEEALTMRVEVEPDAVQEPFFHLWVDNLDLNFVLGAFQFLKVIKDPISRREEVFIIPSSVSCNTTTTTRPANNYCKELPEGIFVGRILGSNMLAFNLSQYVSVKYKLSDSRLLYSQYFKDKDTISNSISSDNTVTVEDLIDLQQMQMGSLYPSDHQYDISFWLNERYSYTLFLQLALEVYGLLLKSVKLLESYKQEIDHFTSNASSNKVLHKVSHCYRLTIQSLDLAMSRNKANVFHCSFREALANKMGLELR